MFGIGFSEIVVIGIVILLVFGPEQLPVLASRAGKLIGTFRKTSDKFRREFYNSVYTPAQELQKNAERNLRAVTEDIVKPAEPKTSEDLQNKELQ